MVSLAVLAFYAILFRESVNLPEMDDYDAILGFLNAFVTTRGFASRLFLFLASEHVQYKLFFEHAVLVAELGLTGHVNFFFLQQLGNLFVLPLVFVLWLGFRPPTSSFANRLLLFTPVVLLLFSPRYTDTLNWAMGSLQNLTVIFFSLLCLYLLCLQHKAAFPAACVAMVFAVASSGNGFFLALTALPLLLQQGQRARAVIWSGIIFCLGLLYSYHYVLNRMPTASGERHPVLNILLFPFVFLGAAALRWKLSLLLALLLLGLAAFMAAKRWRRLDPMTFYLMIFIVITALGVGVTRHNFGLNAALTSRYSIYSQLLLALLYMAALHLGIDRLLPSMQRRFALASLAAIALIYCGLSDLFEVRVLHKRTQLIREHYVAWTLTPEAVSLVPDEDANLWTPGMIEFRKRAVIALRRSGELGIYYPPRAAEVSDQSAGKH